MNQVVILFRDEMPAPLLIKCATDLGFCVNTISDINDLERYRGEEALIFMDKSIYEDMSDDHRAIFASFSGLILGIFSKTQSSTDSVELLASSSIICHVFCGDDQEFELQLRRVLGAYKGNKSESGGSIVGRNCLDQLDNFNTVDMRSSDERWLCYETVGKFAESLPSFAHFPTIVQAVASEMITNAFYDAPKDEQGRPKVYDRREEVMLESHERVTFSFGTKDDCLWLMVDDSFGSLDRETLIRALHRAATERTALVVSKGGAGLGLFMMLDYCSEVFFCLSEGKATFVGCKLKVSKRYRRFLEEQTSVHIF